MKICICGSIAHYAEMEQMQKELEKMGHEVKIPTLEDEVAVFAGDTKLQFNKHIEENGGIEAFPAGDKVWDMKEGAIRGHFKKMEWADAVLITNHEKRGIAGYIGGNTLIEAGVAFYMRKPIYILNPISSELSYKVEILGMKPIILEGNLNRIR